MTERAAESFPTRMPLADAALQLGLSYQQIRDRLLRGDLRGGRDLSGRLYAERADVERLRKERKARKTRRTTKPRRRPAR